MLGVKYFQWRYKFGILNHIHRSRLLFNHGEVRYSYWQSRINPLVDPIGIKFFLSTFLFCMLVPEDCSTNNTFIYFNFSKRATKVRCLHIRSMKISHILDLVGPKPSQTLGACLLCPQDNPAMLRAVCRPIIQLSYEKLLYILRQITTELIEFH